MAELQKSDSKQLVMTWKGFLESQAPGSTVFVVDLWQPRGGTLVGLLTPLLTLHCTNPKCNGYREFRCTEDDRSVCSGRWGKIFLLYHCKNCEDETKLFAVAINPTTDPPDGAGNVYKIGEMPPFGLSPLPPRLLKILGPDKELFLMGRRAESQGMGMGALTYYRRVVEDQKNRIFAELIKACRKLKASKDLITDIEAASKQTQFWDAAKMTTLALPLSLLVHDQNPLVLLHGALSEGIHGKSDTECLQLATDARIVLANFAEKLAQALQSDKEVEEAATRLIQSRSKKKQPLKPRS